jgi:hypothetical protein
MNWMSAFYFGGEDLTTIPLSHVALIQQEAIEGVIDDTSLEAFVEEESLIGYINCTE